MAWRKTGVSLGTFPPGTMREVSIDGATILMANVGSRVYAVDGVCPHEGGILSEGTLGNDEVTCPLHGAVYGVADGHVVADPDGVKPPAGGTEPLTSYPTRVAGGMLEVDLPS